jgi:uncharacterized protein
MTASSTGRAWRDRTDDSGNGFRSSGNENRELDECGFTPRRIASINDRPILESKRK